MTPQRRCPRGAELQAKKAWEKCMFKINSNGGQVGETPHDILLLRISPTRVWIWHNPEAQTGRFAQMGAVLDNNWLILPHFPSFLEHPGAGEGKN